MTLKGLDALLLKLKWSLKVVITFVNNTVESVMRDNREKAIPEEVEKVGDEDEELLE